MATVLLPTRIKFVVVVVASVALVACSSHAVTETASTTTPSTVKLTRTNGKYLGALGAPRNYGEAGIQLEPPPANASASVSWQDAYATCFTGTAQCGGAAPPTIELASATTPAAGHVGPNRSIVPLMQDTLVYVITSSGMPCRAAGAIDPGTSGQGATAICKDVTFVDARTGKVLYAIGGPGL